MLLQAFDSLAHIVGLDCNLDVTDLLKQECKFTASRCLIVDDHCPQHTYLSPLRQ